MGHREKHRRVNWIPERLAAAEKRRVEENIRLGEQQLRDGHEPVSLDDLKAGS